MLGAKQRIELLRKLRGWRIGRRYWFCLVDESANQGSKAQPLARGDPRELGHALVVLEAQRLCCVGEVGATEPEHLGDRAREGDAEPDHALEPELRGNEM